MYRLISYFTLLAFFTSTPALAEHTTDWPDLPVLHIVTVDSVMPENVVVHAPDGQIGSSTKNEHTPGRMVMTLRGDTVYDSGDYVKGISGMRLKIRGNSTGAHLRQHPYKLKLSKKADLLRRGDKKFRHKDWVLLSIANWSQNMKNGESNMLVWIGNIVGRAIGLEWIPTTEYVHVVLNGEYQGMYTLIESVERGESRINVDASGYLIEYDLFWWNEDDNYFKILLSAKL